MDSSFDSNEQIVAKWTFIFWRIVIGRKIFNRKNRFVIRLEYRTKVNRIFSASVSTPLSIPMSKSSRNRLSYFLEFWLVEKFLIEKIDLSRVWNIQLKSIEFSQHQYRLLSRFQWADSRQKDFHIFSNSDWSKIYVFKKWISHGSRASNKSESNFLSISMDSSLGSNEQKVAKWTFIFSRILIGRKILEWKKSVFHRFRV